MDTRQGSKFDVDVALDRNPDEPCCKLLFFEGSNRVGFMLLASEVNASSLRGMHIRNELRGQGLSRVLLATWISLCTAGDLQPTTRTINKPLLALTLARFGFTPVNGRGHKVRVHVGSRRVQHRCHGRQDESSLPATGEYRSAYVRTAFELVR